MKYEPEQEYLNIKEAAAQYEVSRAKLHRLIRLGRLPSARDSRDERATLVKIADLDALFHFPKEDAVETGAYGTSREARAGVLTSDTRARVDELRLRISGGRRLPQDSVQIIREWRDRDGGRGA